MLKRLPLLAGVAALLFLPQIAAADLKRIDNKNAFIQLVQGKTLSRPLVKLRVRTDGSITGRGATRDVTGTWSWKNGFFCRNLTWGTNDLGYNCQEVRANKNAIRFTSDQGTGDSAEFRLR